MHKSFPCHHGNAVSRSYIYIYHYQRRRRRRGYSNHFCICLCIGLLGVGVHVSTVITSCRRAAATICPALSSPVAPKRLAPPSRRQSSSSFPRLTPSHVHRCSRPTHQHGGGQSGLVTLTFDLLTLKVVSESRVTWAIPATILVFRTVLLCFRLRPDVRDRQTSDTSIA